MSDPIRYTRPPLLRIVADCGGLSCGTDTITWDGDTAICRECGTRWNTGGDRWQHGTLAGQLHETATGVIPAGPVVDPDDWDAHRKALSPAPTDDPLLRLAAAGPAIHRATNARPTFSRTITEASFAAMRAKIGGHHGEA